VLAPMVVVLDVGKTLAKLSLWDRAGRLVERRTRANARVDAGDYLSLDTAGIEAWLAETLTAFARIGPIDAIVPVAHGAAVAVLRGGQLATPPIDYEDVPPAAIAEAYAAERDPFTATGSPALPGGLNLGLQLHWLETLRPGLLAEGAVLVPWAQYWSWRLCGVAASEVTSLGCHSDLWRPSAGAPSGLARRRGWAGLMAPLRPADHTLGQLTPEWVERTGLSPGVRVLCGLHDSNAALLASRGFSELAGRDATILSTGTWFVAMRTPADGAAEDWTRLDPRRDCLVNVDASGRPTPSARFMGGREIERLGGVDGGALPNVAAAAEAIAAGALVLPTLTPGIGPFPDGRGGWAGPPVAPRLRMAAACVYAALVADVSLGLIGARGALVIEGRFAAADAFGRTLAALRPDMAVYATDGDADLAYGALRLIDPDLAPPPTLRRLAPLDTDIGPYAADWRRRAAEEPALYPHAATP